MPHDPPGPGPHDAESSPHAPALTDAGALAPPPRPTPVERRLDGLDASRAAAVVGMVMVHIGPAHDPGPGLAGTLYALPRGRASILFVVLAGIGVSLLAGARRAQADRRRRAVGVLLQRAVVLLPVGLALQLLDHGVLVILQYYALYFTVAAAALWLADRALLGAAGALMAAGPVVHLALQRVEVAWFGRPPAELGDSLGVLAVDLLLAGSYPVVTWSGPLLFGMWLGRRDLRDTTVQVRLLVGGLIVAVLAWGLAATLAALLGAPADPPSWEQLMSAEAHSQMPLWLLGASASATAVVGLFLLVVPGARVDRLPLRVTPLALPLVALGQLALTVYVAHLLVLAADADLLRRQEVGPAALSVLRLTVVAAAFAVVWRRYWPRGPLEALLRWPRR